MANIERFTGELDGLKAMRKHPETLYYIGNSALLERRKISIVGSRKPTPYTREMTRTLAQRLSKRGVCIVSGAALGVDGIAHHGAGSANTIAVMGNGIDIRYPSLHDQLIRSIEDEGLVMSPFEMGFAATKWSFVVRNEIVAALGESLIVTQADRNSGTLRSVEFALKMGKKVYVLPQRIGESEGSNDLLKSGLAEAIYDIDAFVEGFGMVHHAEDDELLRFCRSRPTYEEAVQKFGGQLFAYELEGRVEVVDGRVIPVDG